MTHAEPELEPIEPATVPQGHGLDHNFNRYWAGQSLSQFAAQLSAVALPVLSVQLLHANEAELGYLNAASTAAFLLVGLPAGAWVDRWFKRRTMMHADLVRLAAAAMVPILWFSGVLQLWHLYLIAGVLGVATVFFDVAYQSFIPMLVPDKAIGRANSRLESTSQIARLAGPALGGLALKVMSAPLLMLADAIGYAISWVFLLITKDHEVEHRRQEVASRPVDQRSATPNLFREIGEGLKFIWTQPAIKRITFTTSLSNLASTMTYTLMPLVVLRLLGMTPFIYGVILACASVGGLLGATLAGRLAEKIGTARTIRLSILMFVGLGFVYPLALYLHNKTFATIAFMVVEFVQSAGVLIYNVTQVSMRQRLCPKNLLGRMNASIRFIVWGVMPIAALLSGWLGRELGVLNTLWIAAALAVLCLFPAWNLKRHMPSGEF